MQWFPVHQVMLGMSQLMARIGNSLAIVLVHMLLRQLTRVPISFK